MRTIFSDTAKGEYWKLVQVPVVYEQEFYKKYRIGQRGDKWKTFDEINCCKLLVKTDDAAFSKCVVGISDTRTRNEDGIYYLVAYKSVSWKVMAHYLLDNYGI